MASEVIMPATTSELLTADAKVNQNGRILIPVAMREQMCVKPGDDLVLTLEDGILRVETHRSILRRIQRDFEPYRKPGVSMTDEFLAERREEARREREQGLG
jgi:AbrB family looped-hinge helix DNA binding protein